MGKIKNQPPKLSLQLISGAANNVKMAATVTVLLMLLVLSVDFVDSSNELLPDWAVRLKTPDENVAKRIAREHNMIYLGRVSGLDTTYHFKNKPYVHRRRVRRSVETNTDRLARHKDVSWLQQQKILIRQKRSVIHENYRKKRYASLFNDPYWSQQWYLYDSRIDSKYEMDLDIVSVWNMNFTGRGVRITIVDDGIYHRNPDLEPNYDPIASYDFNDNDEDPTPSNRPHNEHGTRCAAEVSMAANNHFCGVGIAYNSRIGGIRILDGMVSDLIEAKALGFRQDYIDIYSASWGPRDNGRELERPGILVRAVIQKGIMHGRNGKGSIFVWAAGNGGLYEDSCSCDGYTSNPYVFSINSVSPDYNSLFFTESCPSVIASTFSPKTLRKNQLITADVNGTCTKRHSGTSASAPMAAGIIALALEANPELTWRDIKHLLVLTSRHEHLGKEKGWNRNKAGYWVHPSFGFGLMDGKRLVTNALKWTTVPKRVKCEIPINIFQKISSKTNGVSFPFSANKCQHIMFIEDVIITISAQYTYRGALHILLRSPNSTFNTTLLTRRSLDNRTEINKWGFLSLHQWGESPTGKWTVYVDDKGQPNDYRFGSVTLIKATFYGTTTIPDYTMKPKKQRNYWWELYDKIVEDFTKRKTI